MVIDYGYGECSHNKGYLGFGFLFFDPGGRTGTSTSIGIIHVEPGQGIQGPPAVKIMEGD